MPTAEHPAVERDEWSFPVEGMECAACAVRIEKQLRKRPGVEDVSVNLASNRARVTFAPGALQLSDLVDTVERTGFSVPHDTFTAPLAASAEAPSADALDRLFARTNGVLDTRVQDDGGAPAIHVRYVRGVADPTDLYALLAGSGG